MAKLGPYLFDAPRMSEQQIEAIVRQELSEFIGRPYTLWNRLAIDNKIHVLLSELGAVCRYCLENNYTGLQRANGKWWAFPPRGVMPVCLEIPENNDIFDRIERIFYGYLQSIESWAERLESK